MGTGTPNVNKGQVSSSYLLELGDGQVFLFDAGTDSIQNLYATGVDQASVTKVFLSHLHSDHITDLPPLYALANRQQPLEVWGPSGAVPATGTNATIEGLKAFLGWDQVSRNHVSQFPANFTGNQIIAHEFPYNQTNALIYSANGVNIYSNIAFHYDTPGPVSLRLNWNGLSVTYSGDTVPLQTFVNFANGSDVVLHETVGPVHTLQGIPVANRNIYLNHTTQAEVGEVFEAVQPRLAIATHLNLNPHTYVPIISSIRSTYPDGPLAIAEDLQVWEISKSSIVQKTLYVPEKTSGYLFNANASITSPIGYELVDDNVDTLPRPATLLSLNTQLAVFGSAAGNTQPSAAAG